MPRGRVTRASEIRTGNTGHPTDMLHNSVYVSRGATSDPRDRRRDLDGAFRPTNRWK